MSKGEITPNELKEFDIRAENRIPMYPIKPKLTPEEHKAIVNLSRAWFKEGLIAGTLSERNAVKKEIAEKKYTEDEIMTQLRSLLRRMDMQRGKNAYSNRSYAIMGMLKTVFAELNDEPETKKEEKNG